MKHAPDNQGLLRQAHSPEAGQRGGADSPARRMGLRPGSRLFLQRFAGNGGVQTPLTGEPSGLRINEPGDVYEQEAERVAEEAMRMPDLRAVQQSGLHSIFQQRLQRQAVKQGATRQADPPVYERADTDRANFCFIMGSDFYQLANWFAQTYYGQSSKIMRARSLEMILTEIQRYIAMTEKLHQKIGQVIIISHANAEGELFFPINDADKQTWFAPADISKVLSRDWLSKTTIGFRMAARDVALASDAGTRVIVKGCNLGQNQAAVDALRELFGGQATVSAPKQRVRLSTVGYGPQTPGRRTPAEAIAWMVRNRYLPPDAAEWPDQQKQDFVLSLFPSNWQQTGISGIPVDYLIIDGQQVPPSDPRYTDQFAVSKPQTTLSCAANASQAATSHAGLMAPAIVHNVLRSPGQPLDAATRALMEPRFGQNLSQVRVHTDAQAAESARAVNALAYTVGRDVVFGAGQHAPATGKGRRLMAHELTHVVQQSDRISSQTLSFQPLIASHQIIQRKTAESTLAEELQHDIECIKKELDSLVYTEAVEDSVIKIICKWAERGSLSNPYLDWIFDGLQMPRSGVFSDTTYYDAMLDRFSRAEEIRQLREGSRRYRGRESATEAQRQSQELEKLAKRNEADRESSVDGEWVEDVAEAYSLPPTPENLYLASIEIKRLQNKQGDQLLPSEKAVSELLSRLAPKDRPRALLKKIHYVTASERSERRKAQMREIILPALDILMWITADQMVRILVEAVVARLFAIEARASIGIVMGDVEVVAGLTARQTAAKGGREFAEAALIRREGYAYYISSVNPVTGEAIARGYNLTTREMVSIQINIDTKAGIAVRENGERLLIRNGDIEFSRSRVGPGEITPKADTVVCDTTVTRIEHGRNYLKSEQTLANAERLKNVQKGERGSIDIASGDEIHPPPAQPAVQPQVVHEIEQQSGQVAVGQTHDATGGIVRDTPQGMAKGTKTSPKPAASTPKLVEPASVSKPAEPGIAKAPTSEMVEPALTKGGGHATPTTIEESVKPLEKQIADLEAQRTKALQVLEKLRAQERVEKPILEQKVQESFKTKQSLARKAKAEVDLTKRAELEELAEAAEQQWTEAEGKLGKRKCLTIQSRGIMVG